MRVGREPQQTVCLHVYKRTHTAAELSPRQWTFCLCQAGHRTGDAVAADTATFSVALVGAHAPSCCSRWSPAVPCPGSAPPPLGVPPPSRSVAGCGAVTSARSARPQRCSWCCGDKQAHVLLIHPGLLLPLWRHLSVCHAALLKPQTHIRQLGPLHLDTGEDS